MARRGKGRQRLARALLGALMGMGVYVVERRLKRALGRSGGRKSA